MEIQNNTDDNVVYEAKDGGGGNTAEPLDNFLNNLKECNTLGCAGNLPDGVRRTLPSVPPNNEIRFFRLVEVPADVISLDNSKNYRIVWADPQQTSLQVIEIP